MNRFLNRVMLGAMVFAWTSSAVAWGPKTDLSVVSTAVHLLSQERVRLVNLMSYVREGGGLSDDAILKLYPNFDLNQVGTIQREMYLLQSVRTNTVDPYYAFRLGALGKLVSQATSPMIERSPTYRDRYFEDIDSRVRHAEIDMKKRVQVDVQAYFIRVAREAQAHDETIQVDYRSGLGFNGLARASMSQNVSRSVNSVADVWYTIFSDNVSAIDMSRSNMRNYIMNSLEFYLQRKKLVAAREVYDRVQEIGLVTTDVRQQIGDMYFDAEVYDQAVIEYQAVLNADPTRRPVMEKMALYYVRTGDDARDESRLEDAQDAFASAVQIDKLHPTAQRKLIEVERLIKERDERLAEARSSVELAQAAQSQAEQAALRGNYAQAITHIRDAQELFMSVTDEFLQESQKAGIGATNANILMRDYKNDLISNAQRLSGSGFAQTAKGLAVSTDGVGGQAFLRLVEIEHQKAFNGLRRELETGLVERP